jgi:chaperonin cofactor prefoldin
MSNQLHGLDTIDQLKSFSQAVDRLAAEIDALEHQRTAHQTSVNQHLTLLTAVADLLTQSIDHYDKRLNVLSKQVKKIDLTIDAIDDHLDD